MKPSIIRLAVTVGSLLAVHPIEAEMVPLRILNRCTSQMPSGTNRYTLNASGGQCSATEGQIFYIPRDSIAGTHPLYWLYQPSVGDHMDSTLPNEGGYLNLGVLGYPYDAQQSATTPVWRLFNSSTLDHATGQMAESIPGYASEGSLGYGYPRYYLQHAENLVTVTAGGVTIKANPVAGGAIWELWWDGLQFINDWDYGRQLQSAVFWLPAGSPLHNPTQAGDKYATPSDPWPWWHGAPVVTVSPSGTTLTTRSIPLEWDPDLWGGDQDTPVLWRGWELGEELTLAFNGWPRVIKAVTHLTSDTAIPDADIQTIAFVLGQNGFTKYYTWSAMANVLTDVTSQVPVCVSELRFDTWSGAGGVITTTKGGSHALGLYGRKQADGGSVDLFQIHRFWGNAPACPPGGGQYGPSASAIGALRRRFIQVGPADFTQYFIVGTLQDVRNDMLSLYNAGF